MDRIALTSSGPYTGCTTLAAHLEVFYGYNHISMSEVLIDAFAEVQGLLAHEVAKNKAHYRLALQEFGDTSGFQTDPVWIERCLTSYDGIQPVVIEKVRTNEQAQALRVLGFIIVNVTVSADERQRRAAALGVNENKLAAMLEHPCEQGICECLIDVEINGDLSIEYSASLIANLTKNGRWA